MGGLLLFALAFLITIDVLARWLIRKPIIGVYEASEIIFLISIFLAAGLVHCKGRQMRVDILLLHVKRKSKHLLEAFADLLGLAFFGLLFWEGCLEWLASWQGHFVRRGMIEIPNTIHLGFLVFGTLIIWLSLLVTIIINLRQIFSTGKIGETDSVTTPCIGV